MIFVIYGFSAVPIWLAVLVLVLLVARITLKHYHHDLTELPPFYINVFELDRVKLLNEVLEFNALWTGLLMWFYLLRAQWTTRFELRSVAAIYDRTTKIRRLKDLIIEENHPWSKFLSRQPTN